MSWPEVDGTHVVVVPVGSCEQHGPHLPLATDSIIAEALAADLVARRSDCLVAPDGVDHGERRAPGISRHVVDRQRGDATGGRRVGPVGRLGTGRRAGQRSRRQRGSRSIAPSRSSMPRAGGSSPGGHVSPDGDPHAGNTETSLMLAVRPDLVRLERAEPGPIPSTAELVRSGVWALSPTRRARRSTGASAEARRRAARPARRRSRPRRRRVAGVTRYRFDRTVERHGTVVIGGSPLKLFRLTAGRRRSRRPDRAGRGG